MCIKEPPQLVGRAEFPLCYWVNKHLQNKVHSLFILWSSEAQELFLLAEFIYIIYVLLS